MTRPAGNPFATCRVRPGAVPFFFRDGESADGLVERLRAAGWWGQIVGPHGTGKSTLLAALLPHLRAAGRDVLPVVRHQGERRLPAGAREFVRRAEREGCRRLLVIDGYEQLSWWAAWRVRRLCRAEGHGLLVTSHADAGLPQLYRTSVTRESARRVVAHLNAGAAPTVTEDEVAARLAARADNLREALFDLYDLHEQRRRSLVESCQVRSCAMPAPAARPGEQRAGHNQADETLQAQVQYG
jgi:hypothetical protein